MVCLGLILGLHPLDAAVVVACLVAVLGIGVWVSRGVKGEQEFFVSGKTMGPWLTFFLNFGQATDSNGAPTVAGEVYRQGIGGMWIAFQTLFITPFIWFTSVWFRRTRLITGPELFILRFDSKTLALCYAWFSLMTVPLQLGLGNIISYKVAAALMVKPAAEYTTAERERVGMFHEYEALNARRNTTELSKAEESRRQELDSMVKRGLIASEVSYVSAVPFYLAYTGIVAAYIMMGGIKAAAVTDAFQGVLIIAFSVMMIPLGLAKVGGFAGLHGLVPAHMFLLFGSPAMSEYTASSVAAIVLGSLVTFGLPGGPATAAARDERAVRLGTLSGVFLKRFVMIAWAFCGLLAFALVRGGLSDPDKAWGALSNVVLFPGLMGLMISGMLLGHMPAVGVQAVNFSATFTRNVYEPLVRGRSAGHYMFVAQASIVAVLAASILTATFFTGVIELLTALIMFNTFFGAVGFLIYFWRRLTAPAVLIGAGVWLVAMTFVAWGVPSVTALSRSPSLLRQTEPSVARVRAAATQDDVAAGRARSVGEAIETTVRVDPKPLFFDRIARSVPSDPQSPMEGLGRFHVENFLVASLGFPLEKFGPAGVTTCRWLVAAISPFAMLIVLSYATGPMLPPSEGRKARTDRFFARMKTPVCRDLAEDARQVAMSEANVTRFDHTKLFPGSSWEFTKWNGWDFAGFFGCWAGVGAILLLLWGLTRVGA